MKKKKQTKKISINRIIISGGGTGGHIFPAVAIGKEIKKKFPNAKIFYVGANGGMEMDLVPKNGFPIEGVWISGIQRQLTPKNILRNLLFPIKFFVSLWQSFRILSRVKPDCVIGVGGYASGPLGRVAAWKSIPLVICEQNAFPGITNRWLSSKATKILLGNADALRYFDTTKCVVTGNPIRHFEIKDRNKAVTQLGLNPDKPVVLVLGGSLGSLSINSILEDYVDKILDSQIQLIWQTGKIYFEGLSRRIAPAQGLIMSAFIDDMATAYSAADLVVSRAGGSTISEMIQLSKPSVLIPSPNVAEDHQTKNALSLVNSGAAVLVRDQDARKKLIPIIKGIVCDSQKLMGLKNKIATFPRHESAREIVEEVINILNNRALK